jgi:hypothetical protein
MPKYRHITPRAKQLLDYLQSTGEVSSREAMIDLDMCGGTLTRRVTELRDAGYNVTAEAKKHPVSGRRYTRYHYSVEA